jgi:hypothetical protein
LIVQEVRVRTKGAFGVALFVLIFTMLGGLVTGHHAVVGYDRDRTVTLKGVVTEWRWRNPHAFLVWEVKDESGKVVQWTGELQSPISMVASGLSRSSFKPGDEVTVTGFPASRGTPNSIIQKVVNAEGKVMIDRGRTALEP